MKIHGPLGRRKISKRENGKGGRGRERSKEPNISRELNGSEICLLHEEKRKTSFPLLQKGKRDGRSRSKGREMAGLTERVKKRDKERGLKNNQIFKKRPVSLILAAMVPLASRKSEEAHLDNEVCQCLLLSKVDFSLFF